MVLTKSYLRYVPSSCFGVISSTRSNVLLVNVKLSKSSHNVVQCAAAPALENVIIWDVRRGEKVRVLNGNKHEVTALAKAPDNEHIAVGYSDGTIKIWNLIDGSSDVTLSGHRSAVSSLSYDDAGVRLVSGSRDTDVIIWDVVNESGLYRFKGHKGIVTQCKFLKTRNILITSSKDTFVKFWDLDTQHCFLTLVGHRSEVWGFSVIHNESRLVTGCADSELRVWRIMYKDESEESEENDTKTAKRKASESGIGEEEEDDSAADGPLSCSLIGSIIRQSKERLVSLETDPTGTILGCHGNDSIVELYKIPSEDEMQKLLHKKLKKARKKQREKAKEGETEEPPVEHFERTAEDEFQKLISLKASSKLRSMNMQLESNGDLKLLLLLNNNSLELHKIKTTLKKAESEVVSALTYAGHRTDIRTMCFSSDSSCLLSGSGDCVKIWNRSSQQCIRTMSSGYALSSFFVPGNRHVVIGTKEGQLEVYDIAAGTLLESVQAHEGAVWGLALAPDKKGFVSGSADKEVKFWEFELILDEQYSKTSKRLTVSHVKTLKMAEDVLAVKYSPDQRFLAVALLDSTVKVFFSDTLKFFLSLYGHKLPVTCMDISSDSTLLVTGSADKNIKIWGLDFGDCHKSIFAHDDSIMDIKFVPKTHYLFTVSKDKTLKYWDADKFEHVMTLEGHHGEVWSLAISHDGDYVVTGAHDKSLRIWEKTDEPLFIEEEREKERETEYEESVAQGPEKVIPGETETEAGKAGKKTLETVKAAERIMEAMELYKEESAKLEEHQKACKASGKELPPPPANPILIAFGNVTPSRYVLDVVKKVRSSELEEALIVLPFSNVVDFLQLLNDWIKCGWETELSCRCLFFLLRIHHNQIISNNTLLPVMESLQQHTKHRVHKLKDTVGFNLAGLRFIQGEMEAKEVTFFTDATEKVQKQRKKRKTIKLNAFK